MFFSNDQRCLTCQHAYVGLSAVCTVCPLPLAAPLCRCNNSKQQKVASRKLVRNKMQKGHRKPRSLRRPQKRSLRFDRAPALETITEKRKWNRAAKVEVVQTAAEQSSVGMGREGHWDRSRECNGQRATGNKVSILMPFTVLISLFTYAHNT